MRIIILSFVLVFILSVSFSTFAQTELPTQNTKPKSSLKDKLIVGGNFGFGFSGDQIAIEVAPLLAYKLSDRWIAGVSGRYLYSKTRIYYDPVNYFYYKYNIYGGGLLSRYNIYRGLFVEGDFELNNVDALTLTDPINLTYTTQREWIPSLLLGGGYAQPIGQNSSFFLSVLYDVLQNRNSPYYQVPVIRAGFGIGL